jgi:hypothetical protein
MYRYVKIQNQLRVEKRQTADISKQLVKVIAMSLVGGNDTLAMGAVRNAQLLPLFFAGWTLRIYLADNSEESGEEPVAQCYVNTLHALGATLVRVRNSRIFPSNTWHYLAADDTSADVVLMRNVDERLTSRDSTLVSDWLTTSTNPFNCILDQLGPLNEVNNFSCFVHGLWAVKPKALLESHVLEQTIKDLMLTAFASNPEMDDKRFLQTFLWPAVKQVTLCQSTLPLTRIPNFRLIGHANTTVEYPLGTKFSTNEMPLNYNKVAEEICPAYRQILLIEANAAAKRNSRLINPSLLEILTNDTIKLTEKDLRRFGVFS